MKEVRFADVRFSLLVDPQKVNEFVRDLPGSKKDSLFEVVRELEQAGLIKLEGQLPPPNQC